jgi:DGQHR domain-containing protein
VFRELGFGIEDRPMRPLPLQYPAMAIVAPDSSRIDVESSTAVGASPRPPVIARRALCLDQPGGLLFLFALRAGEVLEIADISRVARDGADLLLGYQRPPVRKHVEEIREYLDSDGVLFPNSIILALTQAARFTRSRGPHVSDGLAYGGTLEIPLPPRDGPRPAWIVDGQQRALALARSSDPDLTVPVSAFVADDVATQREQFIRINSARPLPRRLVTELLPEVVTPIPARLAAKRLPSAICDALNRDRDSPFFGLIRRPSRGQAADSAVTDTSVVAMLEERLSVGCLVPYCNVAADEADGEAIWQLVLAFWRATRTVFPDAWGRPPSESRLMHGVGIRALGRVMDSVMATRDLPVTDLEAYATRELARIACECRWTSGAWDELGGRAWNELENTSQDLRLLSSLLVRRYTAARQAAA